MPSISKRAAVALSLALGANAALAQGTLGFDLTAHVGGDGYDAVDLKSGLSSSDFTDAQQLRDASLTYGATAVLRLGGLSVGALAERGRPGRTNATTTLGALAGINLLLGRVQLDLLGEVGGQRYSDALYNSAVILDTHRADWLAYVGLRPGVSVHFGERGGVLLGLWGFARRNVMNKDVRVTLADGSGSGAYDLGGTQYGLALRLGFSL
jgi:hypothetical protein